MGAAYVHFDEMVDHSGQQLVSKQVPLPAVGQPKHALHIVALNLRGTSVLVSTPKFVGKLVKVLQLPL